MPELNELSFRYGWNLQQSVKHKTEAANSPKQPARDPHCQPKKNIVFLKTHKCASSSAQNIFLRYGDTHNLTFVLSNNTNLLGPPRIFTKHEAIPLPSVFSNEYNILCHHARWNENNIRSIMPNDTVYITIVREPVAMFESVYQYFSYEIGFNMTLEKFVEDPLKTFYTIGQSPNRLFSWNPVAHDFGFEVEDFFNATTFSHKVPELVKSFDFVLSADHFTESLVMLRDFLCWDWVDVLTFHHNQHTQPRNQVSPATWEKIRKWNAVDGLIYDGFMERFKTQTGKYTATEMRAGVHMINRWTTAWAEQCTTFVDQRPLVSHLNHKLGISFDDETMDRLCSQLTKPEQNYTVELRQRLWPSLNVTPELNG